MLAVEMMVAISVTWYEIGRSVFLNFLLSWTLWFDGQCFDAHQATDNLLL